MSKATATSEKLEAPVWYLAWVRQVALMAGRPNAVKFHDGQQVYFWPLEHDKWMVYDGAETYTILSTEDAKLALKSCRDEQRQVRLAEDQDDVTRRFYQAVARHGTVFACRPRY